MTVYSYPLAGTISQSNTLTEFYGLYDPEGWLARASSTTVVYDDAALLITYPLNDVHGAQNLDAALHWIDPSEEFIVGSRVKFVYTNPPSGALTYRLGYSTGSISVPVDLSAVAAGSVVTIDALGTSVKWSASGGPITEIDISSHLSGLSFDAAQRLLRRQSMLIHPLTAIDLNIVSYPTEPSAITLPGWSINNFEAYLISTDGLPPATPPFWTELRGSVENA